MPGCRLRRCSELVVIAVLLAGGVARADDGDKVADYKEAVAHGSERFNAGDFAGARAEFQRAFAIHPAPVLLFNIASCHRRAGEYDQALVAYEKFVAAAPADDGRLPLARETIEHLRALLAERAEVDAERERVDVDRAPPLPEPTPPPVVAPAPRPQPQQPPPRPGGRLARRAGIGLMVGGALAIGLGVWQGQVAGEAESALETLPVGAAWDDEQAALYQRGHRASTRALVLGIGGAAMAAGGAALYVVGRRMGERPRPITVGAAFGDGRAALVLAGRF